HCVVSSVWLMRERNGNDDGQRLTANRQVPPHTQLLSGCRPLDARGFELHLRVSGDLEDLRLHSLLDLRTILRFFWVEDANVGCRKCQCNRRVRRVFLIDGRTTLDLRRLYQMVMAKRADPTGR